MKFSIIIPAYNSAKFIRNALNSIKGQTFKDYELIVVCDSCTDDTEAIAKEYGARTARVHFHQDGQTRNAGLDMAQGDWVLFMDDDDWWMTPDCLQKISDKLDATPDIDVLCFSFYFKGRGLATPRGNRGNHWIVVWNKAWRREFIADVRFSSVTMISDVDFHQRAFDKHPRVCDWDELIYYYNYLRKGSQNEKAHRR